MKKILTFAALAATALTANAFTVVDTTTNAFSTEDRGQFSLTDTGQTFTTGLLGTNTTLGSIQLQEPRDYDVANAPNSSGDTFQLQIWTDTDANHTTWDPGTLLGTSSNTVVASTALQINSFSFVGVTLAENTVYTIAYVVIDATPGDSGMRVSVTRNANEPSGSYKDGTFFGNGLAPFGDAWDSGFSVTAVPEPSAYALLGGLSALALVMVRRRR